MKNPFLTYGYGGPEYFCDREEETKWLITLLVNGNHVALMPPRRMGKTGLLKHCFFQNKLQQEYYLFIVDIYATRSLAEFTYELGREILSVLKSKEGRAWELFIRVVSSFRTGITIDEFGKPSWNIQVGDIHVPPISLNEIFQYLSAADKPCLVAIDEFQSIMDYAEKNVEALLRTHIHSCNNAWFVFSGSKRHMMGEMFSSPSRPFYQSATTISLKPITLKSYAEFINRHFELNKRHIKPEAIQHLYERFDGTTWYIQKICNELFAASDRGEVCDIDDVDNAIENAVLEKEDTFLGLMSRLTINQKAVLTGLAQSTDEIQPTSGKFIKKYHLASSSVVQRCLAALQDKDIVTNDRGRYYIYDYFFLYWLRRR